MHCFFSSAAIPCDVNPFTPISRHKRYDSIDEIHQEKAAIYEKKSLKEKYLWDIENFDNK